MLVRFIVENLYSFKDSTELNLLPSKQSSKKAHHLYQYCDSKILKMSAIYGANGAGKSNLILSLLLLRILINEDEEFIGPILANRFKTSDNKREPNVVFGLEFIHKETPYLYAIKLGRGKILHEELYKSGLGKKENSLIFERIINEEGENELNFPKSFNKTKEGELLKKVIIKSYKKSRKTFIKILSELEHEFFNEIRNAYSWFQNKLTVLLPDPTYGKMVTRFIEDKSFSEFAKEMMCSFHTGISDMKLEKKELKSFLGDNENELYDEIYQDLLNDESSTIEASFNSETVTIKLENETAYVYRIYFSHNGIDNDIKFYLNDESDGTKRLFEYIPVFKEIIETDKVYVIDEIERSIHPTIIKELIAKFSKDSETNGQLIFSTHESNLLDQEIFRQDEIWFVEKDENASSKLYPLSDFKVHHTKNIQKGYLNGRYGAIPFTGNLKDLKWSNNEVTKPA